MPQFHLIDRDAATFADLPLFVQGYVEAMFWTEDAPGVDTEEFLTDEYQEAMAEGQCDGTIPGDVGFNELHPDFLATILRECETFQKENAADLAEAYDRDGYTPERAGHDYWLTRNGHGTGFWDRDELDADGLGDRLSDAARYSEVNLWFDPDTRTVREM